MVRCCAAALLALSLSIPHSAFAAGGNAHQRRADAAREVKKLLAGNNPQSTLARLSYLGEQAYAARELVKAFPHVVEPERRRDIATVLAGLAHPAAMGQYLEFVTADDSSLRMQGAIGLGRIGYRAPDPLLPLLSDGSMAVRREAAKALGLTRAKKAGRALIRAAKAEGEPEVRAAMLIAVGQAGDRAQADALAGFLDSSSESTRFAAAQGLCLLGHARGFDFAKKLLASEDRFVRRQGVALFEGMPAKKAKPYLEPLLKDPDKRVAASSARILYQGGDKSKLEWLVLASHLLTGDDKLAIERELETLMLTDDRRRAILKKAGIE